MCPDCSARARAEWQLPASTRAVPVTTRRSLRPDFAFAAAVLLLGIAATFGIVVGPQRPDSERAVARMDVAPAPTALPVPVPSPTTTPGAAPSPDATTSPESSSPAPTSPRVIARAPAAPQPDVFADARVASHRASPRPLRVVRVAAKRPVLASYQPLAREIPLEVAAAPEKPIVVAAMPVAWRSAAEARFFQAP